MSSCFVKQDVEAVCTENSDSDALVMKSGRGSDVISSCRALDRRIFFKRAMGSDVVMLSGSIVFATGTLETNASNGRTLYSVPKHRGELCDSLVNLSGCLTIIAPSSGA
jgi:hypothetical protein